MVKRRLFVINLRRKNIFLMIFSVITSLSLILFIKNIMFVSAEENKKFIKYVEFNPCFEALEKAMNLDIKSHNENDEIKIDWIEILAYLGTKYGGDFKKYKSSDIDNFVNKTKNNQKEDLLRNLSSKSYNYYKEAYGTLPTPTKDYYTFNGWYTAASGGEKVTNATVLNVTNDVTIYAQWALNPVSGWVLKSDMPSDAQTVDIKYSYKQTYYKDSQETSMSGWNLYSSKWVKSGSGSFNYATFPSGFDTSHSIYKNFKQSAYSAYENTTSKREVSTSWAGYVYWHWMYDVSYANTTTRAIYNQKGYGPDNGFYYKCFYALTSSTDCPYLDKYYCNTLYLPSYNCHSILPSSKSGIGTPRFFRFDYRKCSYTDYYKLFTYTRSENLESASYPSGENISNIKEWVIYRSK